MLLAGRLRFARTGHAAIRWLSGDARDVVELVPRRHRHEVADDPRLLAGLARWRRRIEARRAVAVLRRSLIAAVVPAIVLGLLVRAGWIGLPVAVAVAVAAFLLGVAVAVRARTRPARVADLLDRDLGLAERLGTALEIERDDSGRRPTVLDSRVLTGASAAISDSLGRHRAAARPLSGEWGGLLAGAAALALVAFALPTAGSGNEPSPMPGTAANRPAATDQGRSASEIGRRREQAAVLGNLPANPNASIYGHQFEVRDGPRLNYANPLTAGPLGDEAPPVPPGEGPPHAGAGAELSGSPGGGGARSQSANTSPSRADGVEPVAAPSEGGRTQTAGGTANARTPAAAARPGNEGEPATPPSPLAGGGAAQPARGEAQPGLGDGGGGSAATRTAGHHRGTTREGDPPRSQAGSGSRGLPLQTGLEPSRGEGPGRRGGSGSGAGLGPGPIQPLVGAPGPPAAGAFPYIPPDGASAAGSERALLLSYLDVLSWLIGRP